MNEPNQIPQDVSVDLMTNPPLTDERAIRAQKFFKVCNSEIGDGLLAAYREVMVELEKLKKDNDRLRSALESAYRVLNNFPIVGGGGSLPGEEGCSGLGWHREHPVLLKMAAALSPYSVGGEILNAPLTEEREREIEERLKDAHEVEAPLAAAYREAKGMVASLDSELEAENRRFSDLGNECFDLKEQLHASLERTKELEALCREVKKMFWRETTNDMAIKILAAAEGRPVE